MHFRNGNIIIQPGCQSTLLQLIDLSENVDQKCVHLLMNCHPSTSLNVFIV